LNSIVLPLKHLKITKAKSQFPTIFSEILSESGRFPIHALKLSERSNVSRLHHFWILPGKYLWELSFFYGFDGKMVLRLKLKTRKIAVKVYREFFYGFPKLQVD